MTLVNREAWYTVGCLYHGKIIEQNFNPDVCTILLDNGERMICASIGLALTLSEAINQCEENEYYWNRAALKLKNQL